MMKKSRSERLVTFIEKNNLSQFRAILRQGVNLNEVSRDNQKFSPLWLAAMLGDVQMVKELLIGTERTKGADPNIVSYNGQTPLHAACIYEEIDVVKLLMTKDKRWPIADPNIIDHERLTALWYAHKNGNVQILRLLIRLTKLAGLSLYTLGPRKNSLLFDVIRSNDNHTLRMLLSVIVNINFRLRYTCGKTPLLLALSHKNYQAATLLINAGAEPNICDSCKFNALHYICKYGRNIELALKLLRAGANHELACNEGYTPLELAIHHNSGYQFIYKLINELIRLGKFNLDMVDDKGNNLLHIAAMHRRLDVARLLIRLGINVSEINNNGKTAYNIYEATLQEYYYDDDDIVAHRNKIAFLKPVGATIKSAAKY